MSLTLIALNLEFPQSSHIAFAEVCWIAVAVSSLTQVYLQASRIDRDRQTLKSGPGHMESTALPGQPGNSVLSGHRTTHGRPFFDFDLLEIGDSIEVETAVGVHVYRIREMRIVQPTDVWVTDDRPGGWMTLTTCNPKFSARERLVVWAEMVSGPNYQFIQLHEARFG